MATYVIGIDGGGTKTVGVVTSEDGTVLALERYPSTNPHSTPPHKVREILTSIIETLALVPGIRSRDLTAVCLSMAGVDTPRDRDQIAGMVAPLLGSGPVLHVVNDTIAAIMATLGRPHGMILISGTGSVCFGYDEDHDRIARCGGWGHIIGDEGSGYRMGLGALQAVIQAFDGRRGPTSLTARVMGELELSHPTDILAWLQRTGGDKSLIAALSRHVHEADAQGDAAAAEILDASADALATIFMPPYRQLFADSPQPVQVALFGGNLVNSERFRNRVERRLETSGLPLTCHLPIEEAALGAARYALRKLRR